MSRRIGSVLSLCLLCASGCVSYDEADFTPVADPSDDPTLAANASAMCHSADLEAAYDATDHSIHELITCGGMQVQLAQSMVALLLVSNDRMYDEQTRQDLAEIRGYLPENPFTRLDDDVWRIEMGSGSTFDLRFYDPRDGTVLTQDPFDMESYLVGLRATYDLSFAEMEAEPDRKNTWTFQWDELGPLAGLLNAGKPVAQTFTLELSLNEIITVIFPGWTNEQPDLGPFDSLLDMQMDSIVDLHDERQVRNATGYGPAMVDYRIHTERGTVREISDTGALGFVVESLTAEAGSRQLDLVQADLSYAASGGLVGALVLDSGDDSVVADFGDGQRYPTAEWSCE